MAKSRYTFTLTDENMEWFHAYLKKSGSPKGVMSSLVDEFISDLRLTVESLQKIQSDGKPVGIGDLFKITGDMISKKENPELPFPN